MKVRRVDDPVHGEWVAGVHPAMSPDVEPGWASRVNMFTGRHLSDLALNGEQDNRGGRLAALGQSLSPGVVNGLDAGLDLRQGVAEDQRLLEVLAGSGIAHSGEDVLLPKPLRLPLRRVPVYAPVEVLDGTAGAGPGGAPPGGGLRARRLGPSLGELAGTPGLSPAAVLVLQPVEVELKGRDTPRDPCEVDPSSDPFDDWQRVDGCRLVFYAWPDEWLALPSRTAWREAWRNALAHAIFERERQLAPGEAMPWNRLGVAVGLVGFDETWRPMFLDRHSVVRGGGRPLWRGPWVTASGSPFHWQARMEQFNGHVADAMARAAADRSPADGPVDAPGGPLARVVGEFRFLPPAGILPRQLVDFESWQGPLLPRAFHVDAIPVPLEQLDLAVRASISLEGYDTTVPDHMRLLVPVPETLFEPGLLHRELPDPEFQRTLDRFLARRASVLARRGDVRSKASALALAATGNAIEYPSPDPDALDADETPGVLALALVAGDDQWRLLPGREAPPGAWNAPGFDDRDWVLVRAPLGYGDPGLASSLDAMEGSFVSVFLRRRFYVEDPEAIDALQLQVQTSGGFAAYLNGVQVAAGALDDTRHDTTADPASPGIFVVDLTEQAASIVAGDNVLALQAHNTAVDAARFNVAAGLIYENIEAAHGTVPGDEGPVSEAAEELAGELSALPIVPGGDAAARESELRTQLRDGRDGEGGGLERLIRLLTAEVDRANDAIDMNFLRVQTDIYRVRQLMLGTTEASRLATSPVLASIARGETALGTKQELADLFKTLKESRWDGAATIAGGGGGEPPGGAPGTGTTPPPAPPPVVAPAPPPAPIGLVGGGGLPPGAISVGGGAVQPFAATGGLDALSGGGARAAAVEEVSGVSRSGQLAQAGLAQQGIVQQAAQPLFQAQFIQASAFTGQQQLADQILEQGFLVGKASVFRTTTLGERLKRSPAEETKNAAVATKYEVLTAIMDLALHLDDLNLPGFLLTDGAGNWVDAAGNRIQASDAGFYVTVDAGGEVIRERVRLVETRRTLGDVRSQGLDQEVLSGLHDPDPLDGDEPAFFSAAVAALEDAAAWLRLVEGRTHVYRSAVSRCRKALDAIALELKGAEGRLAFIGGELAEARHDVGVARALLAEELARVDRVNDRRARVLAEHVPFLAFHRPRLASGRVSVPARVLEPAAVPDVLPACLVAEVEPPVELGEMMDLLREAPVRWFASGRRLVAGLTRLEEVRAAIAHARRRAGAAPPLHRARLARPTAGGPAFSGIAKALSGLSVRLLRHRERRLALDLSRLRLKAWRDAQAEAMAVLSLGDLIDANHGRTAVAQAASRELDNLSRVAACLYRHFDDVPGRLRLDWAERLSQFDDSLPLRDLFALPRWDRVDYVARRQMQSLADWLHGRVDSREPEAVAAVDDLIRVCLLLASHAPVNRIVSARVASTVTVRPGGRLDLVVDASRVRVGMEVAVFHAVAGGAGQTVLRAVVEDLVAGQAVTRVIQTTGSVVRVEAGTRAQVSERGASGIPIGGRFRAP